MGTTSDTIDAMQEALDGLRKDVAFNADFAQRAHEGREAALRERDAARRERDGWIEICMVAARWSMGRNELLAELELRQRQPVIPTCGDCSSCVSFYEGNELLPCAHCVHARERDVPPAQSPCPVVDAKAPPPDWCPWRST